MEDDEPKALIVRPTSGLQQYDSGAEKVLSRIVSDALTVARGRDIADTSARIWVGKHEFRSQDYLQIVIWAQEAGKSPEELVSFLEDADNYDNEEESFLVDDGAIKNLTLPEFEFPQRRLQISHLPKLTKLYSNSNELTELDLSNVSSLTKLGCAGNQLTELDLTNVPALIHLNCSKNKLTKLDLSSVPNLTKLSCSKNQLIQLDLTKVPALTNLRCDNNQINELDVRENHQLTTLKSDPWVRIIKHEWQSFKLPKY